MKAFKEKNANVKNLLAVVKGEMQTTKKNLVVTELSDEQSIKILSKIPKNLKENISLANDQKSIDELVIIESYLPKQMSEVEINTKLDEIIGFWCF
jgi:uncharacterized protein YqeY